jgi:hypothetical protein
MTFFKKKFTSQKGLFASFNTKTLQILENTLSKFFNPKTYEA